MYENNEFGKTIVKEVAKRKAQKWLIGILLSLLPLFLCIFVVFLASGLFEFDNDFESISGGNYYRTEEKGFTISKTSLSKSEYKKKLEELAAKYPNFEIFAENANDIYEYAISKRINPELVPIRAWVEGNGTTTGTYNYWGMGCTNTGGLAACFNYSSFEEGYTDYINNISQYSSLADMMSRYAYIGKYWYNPGSSSIGGCYYAPHIYTEENTPTRVRTACSSVAPQCTLDDTTNCTPTTDEDQTAYATWQVEQAMGSTRKMIFGLEIYEGPHTYGDGNVQYLSSYNLNANGLITLNRTLEESEMISLNEYINDEIDKANYGTGAAVAAAGQSLIYWLEQKNYYLSYYWGGGHGSGDGNNVFVGVNPNWGSSNYGCDNNGRCHLGMDCSGFVSWTIRTACDPKFGAPATSSMVNKNYGSSISIDKTKPGDLMLMNGHVRLVIQNNGDGSVIVAEEVGLPISGLIFAKRTNDSNYKFIDMSSYYENNCLATNPNR